jgi:hypothetical protein
MTCDSETPSVSSIEVQFKASTFWRKIHTNIGIAIRIRHGFGAAVLCRRKQVAATELGLESK